MPPAGPICRSIGMNLCQAEFSHGKPGLDTIFSQKVIPTKSPSVKVYR